MKNSVQIIGNIGQNPAVYELQGGNLVARFRVATHENIRNGEGKKEATTWHNVVAWGELAKYVEKHLTKGSFIALEGKLISRNYEDRDGKKHEITEIRVNEIFQTENIPVKIPRISKAANAESESPN